MSATPPQALRPPHAAMDTLRRYRGLMNLLQRLSPPLAARVGLSLFLRPYRRTVDPRDAVTLARALRSELRVDGEKVVVYDWNGGRRLAVLAHGWGSHAPRFAPLVEGLLAAGYRVVAFDAPGHGQSTGRRSSLPQFGAALAAVLAQHGPAQLLVGHSLGALAITLAVGDGLVAAPDGIVLIGMPSGAPFLLERYQEMFGIGGATARRLLERFEKRFDASPGHFAAERVASRLGVPVLLVHDANDDVVPTDHSHALARLLPHARVHDTQGLGHSNLLRDPATIELITDFARELASD